MAGEWLIARFGFETSLTQGGQESASKTASSYMQSVGQKLKKPMLTKPIRNSAIRKPAVFSHRDGVQCKRTITYYHTAIKQTF